MKLDNFVGMMTGHFDNKDQFNKIKVLSDKYSNNGEVPLPIKFFLKTYTKNLTNPSTDLFC